MNELHFFELPPIEQDPLFVLDDMVQNERCFLLPKEGESLIECQDSYAIYTKKRQYAVADGVSGSFMAGPWARIIAKSFAAYMDEWLHQETFEKCLRACCNEWQEWMLSRWVPTINASRQEHGQQPLDWSEKIRQGAQTTILGCSLLQQDYMHVLVQACAIGDCELFLFHPHEDGTWDMAGAFPFNNPHDFTSRPNTLSTIPRPDLFERAWQQKRELQFYAQSGDLVVLATDTVARWILTQIEAKTPVWRTFLTTESTEDFKQIMRHALHCGQMEDDDITLLIIPV